MIRALVSIFVAAELAAIGCAPTARHTDGTPVPASAAPLPAPAVTLRSPEDIAAAHADRTERSIALFLEAARVFEHPRCQNCHPEGDSPYQGDVPHVHDPPVERGPDGGGDDGLECSSCHQDRNLELARVPGAPSWHLAPREMAWMHRSTRQICEQVRDPRRNGGRTLEQVADHSAHDPLVGWGWHPGADRQAAPGTQALFGSLVAAWVQTGAACPPVESRP